MAACPPSRNLHTITTLLGFSELQLFPKPFPTDVLIGGRGAVGGEGVGDKEKTPSGVLKTGWDNEELLSLLALWKANLKSTSTEPNWKKVTESPGF